jgi:hypothetical protein
MTDGSPTPEDMDWPAWARTFESVHGPEEFAGLFAADGTFCDPVTPPTTDLRKVARDTDAIFPDWSQTVDRIRGGRDWAVFEWTGRATFDTGEGRSARIEMQGATVIEVDAEGKVTRWRDYLDTNEPAQQIRKALEDSP